MPCFLADSNHHFGKLVCPYVSYPEHRNMRTEIFSRELPTELNGVTFRKTVLLHSPQLGPQSLWCYILRLQICTLTTKGRAVLSCCLLLTLLFLTRFNFTEETINAHFFQSYLLYRQLTNRQHTVRLKVIRNQSPKETR